jgi:hypothetical protein
MMLEVIWLIFFLMVAVVAYMIYATRIQPFKDRYSPVKGIGLNRGHPDVKVEATGRVYKLTNIEDYDDNNYKLIFDWGADCIDVCSDEIEVENKRQALAGAEQEPIMWMIPLRRGQLALDQARELQRAIEEALEKGDKDAYRDAANNLVYKVARAIEDREKAEKDVKAATEELNEWKARYIDKAIDQDIEVDMHVDRLTKVAGAQIKARAAQKDKK